MATVTGVVRHSPAYRKVHTGDRLLAINGNPIGDVLDYKYYSYDERLMLEIETGSGAHRTIAVSKSVGEDLGLEFETYLMDGPRSCSNRCIFCFIDQLPPGARETLRFKDDDARLSFLLGNYITLTNLSERELSRIVDLRISPINISVHTTDPELRVKMLRNSRADRLMSIMQRFADAGIRMNCQIVCCPGVNDASQLQRSMEELAALHPAVASVSVVPVGITKYRDGLYPLEPVGREKAAEILDAVDTFGCDCLERLGTRLFFCADELYLKAGREIPPEAYYEDYPQLENGVGMMRSLEEEFILALREADKAPEAPFSIATGFAATPYLTKILELAEEKCGKINGTIYPIRNDFFGESVDVAGLVTGGDIVAQLKGRPLGDRLLIPASMLRHGGDVFLDDMPREAVEEALGVRLFTVPNDGQALCNAIFEQETR